MKIEFQLNNRLAVNIGARAEIGNTDMSGKIVYHSEIISAGFYREPRLPLRRLIAQKIWMSRNRQRDRRTVRRRRHALTGCNDPPWGERATWIAGVFVRRADRDAAPDAPPWSARLHLGGPAREYVRFQLLAPCPRQPGSSFRARPIRWWRRAQCRSWSTSCGPRNTSPSTTTDPARQPLLRGQARRNDARGRQLRDMRLSPDCRIR